MARKLRSHRARAKSGAADVSESVILVQIRLILCSSVVKNGQKSYSAKKDCSKKEKISVILPSFTTSFNLLASQQWICSENYGVFTDDFSANDATFRFLA